MIFDENEARKIAEAALRAITLSTSRTQGTAFFQTLVQELAHALGVCYVIAGQLVRGEVDQIQTLAISAQGELIENIRYSLANTPCKEVTDQTMCFHPCQIQQAYPLDVLLVDMQAESYIGMPMVSSQGETLGILVALDTKPMTEDTRLLALSLLSIFSARCAAELEHRQSLSLLEEQLARRTATLLEAQTKIIEQEKLSSLGGLVAGVAHEVNTPIGVALLAASTLNADATHLKHAIESNQLTRSELLRVATDLASAAELVVANLLRAGELVSSFKLLATEQTMDEVSQFDLGKYINSVLIALGPEIKKHKASLLLDLPSGLQARLPSGAVAQILTNLLMNSLLHAFAAQDQPEIRIGIRRQGHTSHLLFADNGCGVTESVQKKLFEPFFTTRRGQGGTGLGLNVVHNLVNQLGGRISVHSNQGLQFEIDLPDVELPKQAL